MSVARTVAGRDVALVAIRMRRRSIVAATLATLVGFVCFLWPFVLSRRAGSASTYTPPLMFGVAAAARAGGRVRRDRRRRHRRQGARDARRAVGRSTPGLRPLGAGTAGIETVFFMLVFAGRVFGPGLRLRARLHLAVRLGDHHRRRRAVDAVPDVRLRLGRAVRRAAPAAAAGKREIAMLAAYGVFAGYFFGFMLNLSVLAVLGRPGQLDRLPARRAVHRAVAPLPAVRRDHLARLGHRPRGHRPDLHPAARPRRAHHLPPRRPPRELQPGRHLRPSPRRANRPLSERSTASQPLPRSAEQ